MLRVRELKNIHKKRSLRPLYAWHQATPWAMFLDLSVVTDPDSTPIVPGMVARSTTGELVAIHDGSSKKPLGLFANYVGGDLDELGGGTEIGVWRGGPDAQFEVLADALDSGVTWTSAAHGAPLYSTSTGLLSTTDAGSEVAVAYLLDAPSNSKIVIALAVVGP